MNSCQDIEKFESLFCENLYRIFKRSLYTSRENFYINKIIKTLMGSNIDKRIFQEPYIFLVIINGSCQVLMK